MRIIIHARELILHATTMHGVKEAEKPVYSIVFFCFFGKIKAEGSEASFQLVVKNH